MMSSLFNFGSKFGQKNKIQIHPYGQEMFGELNTKECKNYKCAKLRKAATCKL